MPGSGQVVFDIGSQQGLFAIHSARLVGPAGKVVCVEPESSNFARLSRNIAMNSLSHILSLQAAVSDRSGTAVLYRHPFNTGGHSLVPIEPGGDGPRVRLVTLDGLAEQVRVEPDLIKIDVEGSALAVAKGGSELLRRKRPALIIEKDDAEQTRALAELLASLGYSVHSQGNTPFASAATAPRSEH